MLGERPTHIFEPGTEVSTAAGGGRRYRKPLKCLRWSDIEFLFGESFDAWNKHKAPRLGASLAFYTLLSLTPLLLVMVAVVGLVFGHATAQREVVRQVQMLIGGQGAKAVEALLQASRNTTHGAVAAIAGLVTLLFGASGVMIELRDALNTIWEVPTPKLTGIRSRIRSYIKERLFSFAMLLSIGFLLVVSLALSAWISALGAVSVSVLPSIEAVLQIANALISFALITGLFAAMYKIMPDVRIEWEDVILGGAVTSFFFTIGKSLLGLYLGKAGIASSYGAFASIVVVVIWVYYSGQILFLGAEFTRAFANHYGSRPGGNPENINTLSGNTKPPPAAEPRIITPPGTR